MLEYVVPGDPSTPKMLLGFCSKGYCVNGFVSFVAADTGCVPSTTRTLHKRNRVKTRLKRKFLCALNAMFMHLMHPSLSNFYVFFLLERGILFTM